MEKIKLVIWDLDETFWKGTLSEGEVSPISNNITLIKELTNRGIINSISSKNDFAQAKEKLEELQIWDYFVFPHIDWVNKGESVKNIISKMNLRSINVLFIDDNHLNLKEVEYYNEKIHCKTPDFISKILGHPAFIGKDDTSNSRLNQYKILELKNKELKNYSNNEEFLRESGISISINDDPLNHIDRILELINRTNQLNYTKKRINKIELKKILNNDKFSNIYIKSKDKYGDYGIVGFISINKQKFSLEHFLFSCRVINIGIEQFILNYLKYPKLNIVGEVAIKLKNDYSPDWITVINNWENENKVDNNIKILLKGGCDLEQLIHYLTYKNLKIDKEFNYPSADNIPIHREHTMFLFAQKDLNQEAKNYLIKKLPFIDDEVFNSSVFEQDYDILIYSLLMDYTHDIYYNKRYNVSVPFGGYTDLTNKDIYDNFSNRFKEKGIFAFNDDFYSFFSKEFENKGQLSKEMFIHNLTQLINNIKTPVIFINGTEVKTPTQNKAEFGKAYNRHVEMNSILDKFIKSHKNVYLLDMRKIVSQDDIKDNIRHYKRYIYEKMANELILIIEKIKNIKVKKENLKFVKNKYKKILKDKINRFF